MSVDFNVKVQIKRAMETGELLYLDYSNKEGKNTFYFFGINFVNFSGDKSTLSGFSYNYQHKEYIKVNLTLDRINNARCVEGTKNFTENKLKNLLKKRDVKEYFSHEINASHIMDYYADCIDNSEDYKYVDTHVIDSMNLEDFRENHVHKIDKTDVDIILKMININPEKAKEKYKLSLNYISVKEINGDVIPLVYYPITLDPFKKIISISKDDLLIHSRNLSKVLAVTIQDLEQYTSDFDVLLESLRENQRIKELVDTHPYIFKLSMDLSLSPRGQYKEIKNNIFNKKDYSNILKAFFGNYKDSSLMINRNLYFKDEYVNAAQISAIYSSLYENLTYVQGPPGTGKTATIVNMIISSLMNKEKTLVTSYTNKAVDNVLKKMNIQFSKYKIPIPLLRVGSSEYTSKGINMVKRMLNHYESIRDDIDIKKLKSTYKKEIEKEVNILDEMKNVISENKERVVIENNVGYYDKLEEILLYKGNKNVNLKKIRKLRGTQKSRLTKHSNKNIDNILNEIKLDYEVIRKGLFIFSIEKLDSLYSEENSDILAVFNKTSGEERLRAFNGLLKDDDSFDRLTNIFPLIFTTNISSRKLGSVKSHFDLLIMDEAGQCENGYALLAMARANRGAFIGDPNQLLPVITVSDRVNQKLVDQYRVPNVYNYKETSVLNTLNQVDLVNDLILLKKHYRCKKSIVEFSNKKYYNSSLEIQNMNVGKEDCKLLSTNSFFHKGIKNTSLPEALAIVEEIKKLPDDQSIGIISPFKNQASLINDVVKKMDLNKKVSVGTIHKFQGQEEDNIFLSLALGNDSYQGSYDWVKNNRQLINVATTRPKEKLIVVGDRKSLQRLSKNEESDLIDLVNYTSEYNYETFNEMSVGKIYDDSSNKKLYTSFESEFFDTLKRVLGRYYSKLYINGQTSVAQLLSIDSTHELFNYASKAAFDFVVLDETHNAKLAIELCGVEHYIDQKVIERDNKKKKIAEQRGLDISYINNRDARRYYDLKEILQKVFK
ncbi:AAA domain-containing protein [Mycoplasmatota bacterium WC44]